MITAIDTNILLDVLIPGEPFGQASKTLLDRHLGAGQLIISEVVFAELAAEFPADAELTTFLSDTGIRMVHSDETALYLAGTRWAEYAVKRARNQFSCAGCGNSLEIRCPRCGKVMAKRLHVLADFLIGSHALTHADCLISRDLGLYKTYFSDLKVVSGV